MSHYTELSIVNNKTGEYVSDLVNEKRSKFYFGPRKYWRTMELYDKALLELGSRPGMQLMMYIKGEVDTSNYRISFNASHMAEDMNLSRQSIMNNIKRLVDGKYIHKEKRGKYFINPSMFWIQGMNDKTWQSLKQEYIDITGIHEKDFHHPISGSGN